MFLTSFSEAIVPSSSDQTDEDVALISKILKGNTEDDDSAGLITLLCKRTNKERLEISKKFKSKYSKDLSDEIENQLDGNLQKIMLAMFLSPIDYDCLELKNSLKGMGTVEDTLIEILSTRSSSRIREIIERYPDLYVEDLEEAVKDDTSGLFQKLLQALMVNKRSLESQIEEEKLQGDLEVLNSALEKNGDTNKLLDIFSIRSQAEIRYLNKAYYESYGIYLDKALKAKFSNDELNLFKSILDAQLDVIDFFSNKLIDVFKGIGTNDESLIRIFVSRNGIDLREISEAYMKKTGKSLQEKIQDECSGEFKIVLLGILNSN